MSIHLYQVDAFTTEPFKGNPAAVCILTQDKSNAWMQALATEMNLSETAFLLAQDGAYQIRWFTPTAEVDLCGHATLATAHVMWESRLVPSSEPICFQSRSGLLMATFHEKGITLDFPVDPPKSIMSSELLEKGLGVPARYIGQGKFDYLVEVESEKILRELAPDLDLWGHLNVRGIIVTAPATSCDLDFVSRCFYPAVGVPEDPVTGSAHCCLAPYWVKKLGKNELKAYQASLRGGSLHLKVERERVFLTGQAVTIFTGQLAR